MTRAQQIARVLAHVQRTKPFFWLPPFGYYEQASLTDQMIDAAERTLGLKLPVSLLAILKLQNGGELRYNRFGSESERNGITMDVFFGIGPPHARWPVVLEESAKYIALWDGDWRPCLAQTSVLLAGDVHWWVGLDYRDCGTEGEPEVINIENETLDEETRIRRSAESFDRFLDGLYNGREDYAFGFVAAPEDSRPLRATLERCLGVEFRRARKADFPDSGTRDKASYVASHPTWHRWLPERTKTPATLLLKRNKYARPAEHYDFPLHPECGWVLECDIHSHFYEKLEHQLAEVPYQVVLLHLPPWDKLGW